MIQDLPNRRLPKPHRCHATGCRQDAPPDQPMCNEHWAQLPDALQKQLSVTAGLTTAFAQALRLAVRALDRQKKGEREPMREVINNLYCNVD